MNIPDELRKLQEMHASGALTDDEFAQAKAAVLGDIAPAEGPRVQEPQLPPAVSGDMLLRSQLRTMQIVAFALLTGVGTFLAMVLFIVNWANNGQGMLGAVGFPFPFLTVIALAMLAVEAPLAFLIPAMIVRSNLQQIAEGRWQAPSMAVRASDAIWPVVPVVSGANLGNDNGKLLAVRRKAMIIGLALLESAAFMGCMAYLLEANVLGLAVVGVAVMLMLIKFPTEGGIRAWLDRQSEILAELRQQQEMR